MALHTDQPTFEELAVKKFGEITDAEGNFFRLHSKVSGQSVALRTLATPKTILTVLTHGKKVARYVPTLSAGCVLIVK